MTSKTKKLKILLSAYACEPNRGSEPGVGWRWASGLASKVDLKVLTRESNRVAINKAIGNMAADDPLRMAKFIYYDLPNPWLWMKKHGLLPTMAYYVLWQWSACKRFALVADEADVVHHLTFCTLLCPGFWNPKKAKLIIGPIGAPLVNPHYYPVFGSKQQLQRLRGWLLKQYYWIPWLDRVLRNASSIVPANSETKKLLEKQSYQIQRTMLDTGATETSLGKAIGSQDSVFRIIYAGQLERRKGLELSLRALAKVSVSSTLAWEFHIFGNGPDMARLQGMAEKLGIVEHVKFHGRIPQSDLMIRLREMDTFIFTSVRDTSASVNLEAMENGLPIICIAHQGVADITDDSCAIRISPSTIDETIERLAEAIIQLAKNSKLRARMSQAAAKRAKERFSWNDKFEQMINIYKKALSVA